MTTIRSNRAETRNPLLTLPATRKLLDLPRDQQEVIYDILRELAADANARAEKCWRTHKAPMAAYWKAAAVYAGHLAKVIGRRARPLRLMSDERIAA